MSLWLRDKTKDKKKKKKKEEKRKCTLRLMQNEGTRRLCTITGGKCNTTINNQTSNQNENHLASRIYKHSVTKNDPSFTKYALLYITQCSYLLGGNIHPCTYFFKRGVGNGGFCSVVVFAIYLCLDFFPLLVVFVNGVVHSWFLVWVALI